MVCLRSYMELKVLWGAQQGCQQHARLLGQHLVIVGNHRTVEGLMEEFPVSPPSITIGQVPCVVVHSKAMKVMAVRRLEHDKLVPYRVEVRITGRSE